MKKLFTILTAVLFSITVWAQSPQKISYQAVVRNASSNLVVNSIIGIQISILKDSPSGTIVYSEIQTPSTNENGLISIEIGNELGFDAIDWSNGVYFIKTEVDPDGGNNYSITGTSQLLSVPYSLHSKTADNVLNVDYNNLSNKPTIPAKVSELTNDAGYLTSFTEVDGSVTNELQVLSLSNDTIYLSNGGFVKLPASFDGDYNNLSNKPTIPANVSELTNDAGYLNSFTEVDGSVTNELQALSLSNDTIYLTNGGFVKLPASFDGNYNNLSNKPTIPANVSELSNDAGYLTSFTEVDGSVTNEIELPTQTGNSGKYLTTDGTSPSWVTIASGGSNDYAYIGLTSDGTMSGGLEGGSGYTTGLEVLFGAGASSNTVTNGIDWNGTELTVYNSGVFEIRYNPISKHVPADIWSTYAVYKIYVNGVCVFNSGSILFPLWNGGEMSTNHFTCAVALTAGDVISFSFQYSGQGEAIRMATGSSVMVKKL